MKPCLAAGIATALVTTALPATAGFAATVSGPPPAPAHKPAVYDYVVKRGDTLSAFAATYLAGRAAMLAVQRRNHIHDVYYLIPGTHLKIPRADLRDETSTAVVAAFSGAVTLSEGSASVATRKGATLNEGADIETGRNAFVTLRLADGTLMSMPSQSHVRLARLRRVLLTGAVERSIELVGGGIQSQVTPMKDPNSNFEVRTPITISGVRGTEFRVSYAADGGTAATSVIGGTVGIGHPAPGRVAAIAPAGFGIASTAAGDSGVIALLKSPDLNDPGKVQTDENLHFSLASVAGAARYHLQVARDAGVLDVISESIAGEPEVTMPAPAGGSYFLRVSAVDGHGIEGLPDVFAFERRRNSVTAAASASGAGKDRRYVFEWQAVADGKVQFHFRLARIAPDTATIADEAGLTGSELAVTNLPPGTYQWQVSSTLFSNGRAIEVDTPPQKLRVFAEH